MDSENRQHNSSSLDLSMGDQSNGIYWQKYNKLLNFVFLILF